MIGGWQNRYEDAHLASAAENQILSKLEALITTKCLKLYFNKSLSKLIFMRLQIQSAGDDGLPAPPESSHKADDEPQIPGCRWNG